MGTNGTVVFDVDDTILATRALVDPIVAKTAALVNGFSGVSTGDAPPATSSNHRIAAYEAISMGGNYFYGIGIVVNANTAGLGVWGGTLSLLPEQGTGSGRLPDMLVTPLGLVGINNQNPSERLHVTGNILCSGSISGATKSFDIPHEGREDWRLRHWCVETDTAGGSLMYKRRITAPKAGIYDLILPDWFAWLAGDTHVHATGFQHFGLCWGERDQLDPCVLHLHVQRGGEYNVLVVADRADQCATTMCPQEVEYLPTPAQTPDDAFPP